MGFNLRFLTVFVIVFMAAGLVLAGSKKNRILKKHVYYEDGMRHSMVVMADENSPLAKPTAGGVIDTISHYYTSGPETWDEGIQVLAGGGVVPDTIMNWFKIAADTAKILEIHASFATTGTGSWNVWPGYYPPETGNPQLLLDVPWVVNTADTTAEGVPTGNLQVQDLDGQGLSAFVGGGGAWVGQYLDGNAGPKVFMDNGRHPFGYADWHYSLMYTASDDAWYYWGSDLGWVEFVIQIVVFYEKVAPVVDGLTSIQDHFAGNPDFSNPSVSAKVFDLDGTVATADLVFAVGSAGAENRVAMTAGADDMYTGVFGQTFSSGDTVHYWIETTDDEGNFRQTASKSFEVVTPPAVGTDILYVDNGGEVAGAFDGVLAAKDYFMWDVAARGGITDYEINHGFDNILWYGYGSANLPTSPDLPSPYETGTHPIKTYLDGGGNLMVVDADYLFGWGYADDTLSTGQFGMDYLGMWFGWSDIGSSDSIHYGVTDDPISGSFDGTSDSLVTMPNTYEVWWDDPYFSDWMDYVVPAAGAEGVFYTPRSMSVGYYTGIRHAGGGFNTAFFPFRMEASSETQLGTVLDNTLAWFAANTAIDDGRVNGPSAYALEQNYPNPFNPVTTIKFNIAKAEKVQLYVYNMLGQKVAALVNSELNAGPHHVTWNGLNDAGQKAASGIYFYELKSGDFSSIKKMLLVK